MPPKTVSNETVGPSFGAGGGGGGSFGGGGVAPFAQPDTMTFAPCWFCSMLLALLWAAPSDGADAPTSSP